MEESVKSYDTSDMIYALATAWGKSAIAVVRVSGDGCIDALSTAFSNQGKLKSSGTNTLVYGHLRDPEDGSPVDDVVVAVYRDGHGYTGEEALEVSCHGGLQVVRTVLSLMEKLGFRKALAGEFTLRAFLHGKMDLTKAEAVEELIDSKGNTGRTMALGRLNGTLFNAIKGIKDILVGVMSTIEVQLDYSEDEIGEDLSFPFDDLSKAIGMVSRIKASYNAGKLYSQGAKVVLAGPTNAGKSSLFNYLLKEDRSIVSSVEGTTRDFIEAQCTIDGIPIRLYDTAGFRSLTQKAVSDGDCEGGRSLMDGQFSIEAQGMERSRSLVDDADIVVYMVGPDKEPEHGPCCPQDSRGKAAAAAPSPKGGDEAAQNETVQDEPTLEETLLSDPRCIVVHSKADILQGHGATNGATNGAANGDAPAQGGGRLFVSVVTGEGFDELCSAIRERLMAGASIQEDGGLVIESERQRECLGRCKDSLDAAMIAARANVPLDIISMDVQEAIEALGEITGEVTTDDVLDRIFGTFCVGK